MVASTSSRSTSCLTVLLFTTGPMSDLLESELALGKSISTLAVINYSIAVVYPGLSLKYYRRGRYDLSLAKLKPKETETPMADFPQSPDAIDATWLSSVLGKQFPNSYRAISEGVGILGLVNGVTMTTPEGTETLSQNFSSRGQSRYREPLFHVSARVHLLHRNRANLSVRSPACSTPLMMKNPVPSCCSLRT